MIEQTRPFPWMCATCREREVYPDTIPVYTETFTRWDRPGATYPISIPRLDVFRCRKCGTMILDDHALRRITQELTECGFYT